MKTVDNEVLVTLVDEINQQGFDLIHKQWQESNQVDVDTYNEQLTAIVETAEMLELDGVAAVIDFVINQCSCLNDEQEVLTQLALWPNLLNTYLLSPQNNDHCMAIIDWVEQTSWPCPMDEDESKQVLNALASVTIETQEEAPIDRDVSISIAQDIDPEVLKAFYHDAPGHLEAAVIAFEDKNSFVIKAQRHIHTLKGEANLVGLKSVANICHHLESFLEVLEQKKATYNDQQQDVMLDAFDCLSEIFDHLIAHQPKPNNCADVLQQVIELTNPNISSEQPTVVSDEKHQEESIQAELGQDELNQQLGKSQPNQEDTNTLESEEIAEEQIAQVDPYLQLAEEMSINLIQSKELYKSLLNKGEQLLVQDNILQERRFQLESAVDNRSMAFAVGQNTAHIDPLELDRYDDIHRSSHQIIESVADTRELNKQLVDQLQRFEELIDQQKRFTSRLQDKVLADKKIAVSSISSRLNRCVRQSSRLAEKKVNLIINDEQLQIDKEVLEELTPALMHLIRNAIDHGIESPQERLSGGKNEAGNITFEFFQQNHQLIILCKDDGKGLDETKIIQKANEKEIDLSQFENNLQCIFSPGFSTKKSANQLSGRGIGLDAVSNAISQLQGQVSIAKSDQHVGTVFKISLPLRQITKQLLLVRVDGQDFAFDSQQVDQVYSTGHGEISERQGEVLFTSEGEQYPYYHLNHWLTGNNQAVDKSLPVLICEVNGKKTALAIDELVHSQELVVKNTGDIVSAIQGYSGICMMANGHMVPVLNSQQLHQIYHDGADYQPKTIAIKNKVLVVDDSLSVRQSLKQLFSDMGFDVLTAIDGLDAVGLLDDNDVQMIVTDMEMPRMNGIELSKNLRRNQVETPIVMITSRTQDKHRNMAKDAGINHYVTKPYDEGELIDYVRTNLTLSEA